MNNGKLIAFEGIDGAGTTTQARLAAEWLRGRGVDLVETCEPSGGPVGKLIRQALARKLPGRAGEHIEPELFALLFAADRLEHLNGTVAPALAEGKWVVSDRCYLSSFAYQSVGCDLDWVRDVNRYVRRADLILLLDLDPELACRRLASRTLGDELDVFETSDQMAAVRSSYTRVADVLRSEGERIVTIDGAAPLEAVAAEVQSRLSDLL